MREDSLIHPVKPDELELLRDIALETFKETYEALNEPEPFNAYIIRNFSTDQILKQFETLESSFFFARCEGDVAGYLKLNIENAQTDTPLERAMEIERIYISQSFKGRGLGKALIGKAIEEAQNAKLDWLWLGVWDQNAHAIEFYQRQGFEIFGNHNFMMGDVAQDDYLMKLRIN